MVRLRARPGVMFGVSLALVGSACSTPAHRRSDTVHAGTFDLVLERQDDGTTCRGVLVLSDTFIAPGDLPKVRGLRSVVSKSSGTYNACLVLTQPAGARCVLDVVADGMVRLFVWGVREGDAYAIYESAQMKDEHGRVEDRPFASGFLAQRANGDLDGNIKVGSEESWLVGTVGGKRRGPADFAACSAAGRR